MRIVNALTAARTVTCRILRTRRLGHLRISRRSARYPIAPRLGNTRRNAGLAAKAAAILFLEQKPKRRILRCASLRSHVLQ